LKVSHEPDQFFHACFWEGGVDRSAQPADRTITLLLPRALASSGQIDVMLIVDGQIANIVQINIR